MKHIKGDNFFGKSFDKNERGPSQHHGLAVSLGAVARKTGAKMVFRVVGGSVVGPAGPIFFELMRLRGHIGL